MFFAAICLIIAFAGNFHVYKVAYVPIDKYLLYAISDEDISRTALLEGYSFELPATNQFENAVYWLKKEAEPSVATFDAFEVRMRIKMNDVNYLKIDANGVVDKQGERWQVSKTTVKKFLKKLLQLYHAEENRRANDDSSHNGTNLSTPPQF